MERSKVPLECFLGERVCVFECVVVGGGGHLCPGIFYSALHC